MKRNRTWVMWSTAVAVAVVSSLAAAQAATKPCDLMKMLQSTDNKTVQKGIEGFVAMGDKAAVPLVCYLAGKAAVEPTAAGKLNAEKALVRLGSAAVPAIVERLGTRDEEARTRYVRVLGRINDVRREEPLRKLWDTEDSDRVRGALVMALTSIPGCDAEALLSPRYAGAGPKEREAMVMFYALHGTDEQIAAALDPAGEARAAVRSNAIKNLKNLGTRQGRIAAARLEKLP